MFLRILFFSKAFLEHSAEKRVERMSSTFVENDCQSCNNDSILTDREKIEQMTMFYLMGIHSGCG